MGHTHTLGTKPERGIGRPSENLTRSGFPGPRYVGVPHTDLLDRGLRIQERTETRLAPRNAVVSGDP